MSGCNVVAGFASGYPAGVLYDGTTRPHPLDREELAGKDKPGDKGGEACASGILGLVAWGDASVDLAKRDAHITEVHSVELRTLNILGLYMQGCTEVHGR